MASPLHRKNPFTNNLQKMITFAEGKKDEMPGKLRLFLQLRSIANFEKIKSVIYWLKYIDLD